MPGPGNRNKTSKKRPQNLPSTSNAVASPDAFVGEVGEADSWTDAVVILCAVFNLPGEALE